MTTLLAPAKLTWTLRIVGRRADGYHLLDAEMVSLHLADELTFAEPGEGLTVDGPFADGVPTDASNLVTRALSVTGRDAAVHVHKRIPHGGGLGGGSSDAATVLRWAGIDDLAVAATLGADVPYCLRAATIGGRARVRGIGELVEPLPPVQRDVTLIVAPFGVSTPAVYRAWDDLGGPTGSAGNDLEPAAIVVEPRLATWRDRIADLTGQRPRLAGSGATWFVEGRRDNALASLRSEGAAMFVTSTGWPGTD